MYQVLTQIVYQVIKKEFDAKCSKEILDNIRQDGRNIDNVNKSQRKGIYLSQIEQNHLFSPQSKIISINHQFMFSDVIT